jgi:hypothetical protein
MTNAAQINSLILNQLAADEMRLLRIIVGVRKNLGRCEKGDLPTIVKRALQKLVASQAVVDADGLYSLSPLQRQVVFPC